MGSGNSVGLETGRVGFDSGFAGVFFGELRRAQGDAWPNGMMLALGGEWGRGSTLIGKSL